MSVPVHLSARRNKAMRPAATKEIPDATMNAATERGLSPAGDRARSQQHPALRTQQPRHRSRWRSGVRGGPDRAVAIVPLIPIRTLTRPDSKVDKRRLKE